jgi:hypothetical protein
MGAGFCNFSTMQELVALRECLEAHDDHIDLLYLTVSEAPLQVIQKWIGGGVKLSLSRSPDADVLKVIVLKLQKRVEAGGTTLLIKVKAHRGDPLNEETDIRARHVSFFLDADGKKVGAATAVRPCILSVFQVRLIA